MTLTFLIRFLVQVDYEFPLIMETGRHNADIGICVFAIQLLVVALSYFKVVGGCILFNQLRQWQGGLMVKEGKTYEYVYLYSIFRLKYLIHLCLGIEFNMILITK